MAKRTSGTTSKGAIALTDVVLCGQPVDVAYRVPAVQPTAVGTWRAEADKIAWTDPESGYPCIIRREQNGGHLAYYVGLPAHHPLCGWDAKAIPADLVAVPGGLDYSAQCDHNGPEDRSICHVPTESTHDDLWWLGTRCNRITDLKPDDEQHAAKAQRLGIAQEYRGVDELFTRCTALAANLKDLEAEGDRR
jgi:hypothetical protein